QCGNPGKRCHGWNALAPTVAVSSVAYTVRSPGNGSWTVVRADLRLSAADLCLGASRAVLVGNPAVGCCRRRRENCVQYVVLWRHSRRSHNGWAISGKGHGRHEHGCDDAIHSHSVSEQPGFVDRTSGRGGTAGRSDPITPPSRANLIDNT